MAELVFKNMVKEHGLSAYFNVTSFGTSDEEEGNPIYPPEKKTLILHGIPGSHTAKQLAFADVKNNDYILGMDSGNLIDVLRLAGWQYSSRVFKLCSFTENPRDVSDPYYSRNFEKAFSDIAGAYPMINQQFIAHAAGDYQYINREDDVGDPGLRKAKLSYKPDILLEKYVATLK